MSTATVAPTDAPVEDPYLSGEYAGQPVFRKSPPGDHPALEGNRIKKLTEVQMREWLSRQGTRMINIPLDDSDRKNDPEGVTTIFQTFTYFGYRYAVPKDEDTEVPWPIADMWDNSRGKRRR